MFRGYLELNGIPLINSEATEAYVDHLLPGAALRTPIRSTSIHIANEESAYRTPLLDDAPWVNDLDPVSSEFLGLYPIDIDGLDDDTTEATVTEYLSEGGTAGLQREASRPVRVTGLLVGLSPLGVQFGRDWLANALKSEDCVDCTAGVLRYFVADPDVCETGAFGEEVREDSRSFGALGVGIYRYRWPSEIDPAMPMRVYWDATWAEGTAIRYGAAVMEGTDELERVEVFQPFRRNYVRNPTFRNTMDGWALGGTGQLNRSSSDGADNQTFADLISGGGTVTATGSTFSIGAGPAILSLGLRGTDSATVSVLSGSTTLASTTLTPSSDWARYTLPLTVASAGALTIVVSTAGSVDIDQLVLEQGSYAGAYFDGSTVEDGYTVAWEGGTDASIARRTKISRNEIQRDDSAFRPFLQIVSGSATNTTLNWGVRLEQGMDEQLMPYERHLFETVCTSGVKKIAEVDAGGGGAYMQVEFALVAGKPSPFTLPFSINTTPLANAAYADPEVVVVLDDSSWLSDPNAPVVTLPPRAPVILNPAIENISTWRRYYVPIAARAVADFGDSIPTVAITSKDAAINQVRVRFHPNPFGYATDQVDPDNYCSEFVLSYLPAQTRLEVDGVAERAFASRGDKSETAADHLLYGTDGSPISWPKLSCAIAYLMTVDIPPSATIDQFDLEVLLRRKL